MQPCQVELNGQLVSGFYIRSRWLWRRVRLSTTEGYFLAWVPRWRVWELPAPRGGVEIT